MLGVENCAGRATQLTELHSDKSKLRESLLPDGSGGVDATGSDGASSKNRGGGGVSPGPDNVDRQMAYLAAQNQVR